ncbi:tRNA (adenosine(37)-N6)-dimethylallyltransferase MiaA [Marinirhabdus gelatinilytica]|uniref:tRNA dimethylallyltransferase n=1 Tax=Marinirhabdus gelatinilytica TaxID=1703343 RepID=A0A370QET1_9FLAO|nr:tRNA (adenosine(37)-N6)-dimethylallyltransferase MiaA [Marinirhabdus gelatinilytica]RDK86873.1 tRNA dimethylallyltransferase [Marinirhabdus gelatinilytica]
MPPTPLLICIVGPTAIGKTALGIEIAKHFSTEILSADSRQFFKEMAIGTAVPTTEELDAAPHHFIQNRSIFEPYNVGDFEKDALLKLKELFKKHDKVVMVGGSGLYVDAVVKGLDKFPKVKKEVREQLSKQLEEHGLTSLQRELKEKDPTYFKNADIQNPHRLIRALEIIRGTGKPFSSFLKKDISERNFDTLYIGLTAEREKIYERINKRVDIMIENGLMEEARQLYPHKDLNALQTVGYKELFQFFDGEISKEEAVSEIKKNTRRFAKRQGTWFRKNEQIHWFPYTTPPQEIVNFITYKNASPN